MKRCGQRLSNGCVNTSKQPGSELSCCPKARSAGRHKPEIHPSLVLGSECYRIRRSEARSLFVAVLAPIPCLDIKIGVFKGYSPCIPPRIPQPRNRYLYHFIGADTPKNSEIDTMSEFFYFAVFGCWRCEYGLICPKISPIQALLCKISLVPGKTQFHPFSPSA